MGPVTLKFHCHKLNCFQAGEVVVHFCAVEDGGSMAAKCCAGEDGGWSIAAKCCAGEDGGFVAAAKCSVVECRRLTVANKCHENKNNEANTTMNVTRIIAGNFAIDTVTLPL